MQTPYAMRIRLGAMTLPLAGLLALLGITLRGALVDPTTNAAGFAQAAAAANFGTAWVLILIGVVVRLYSFMALYAFLANTRVERLAFWAMVLSLASEALFLAFTGFFAFAVPLIGQMVLQGQTNVNAIAVAGFFAGPATSIIYPSGLIGWLGSILFGIAIWRCGVLPQWSGVLFALTTPLLAFAPAFSYPLEWIGGLLLLVSGVWIAAAIWRPAALVAMQTAHA